MWILLLKKNPLFLFFLLFIMNKDVYYYAGNVTEEMQLHCFWKF